MSLREEEREREKRQRISTTDRDRKRETGTEWGCIKSKEERENSKRQIRDKEREGHIEKEVDDENEI